MGLNKSMGLKDHVAENHLVWTHTIFWFAKIAVWPLKFYPFWPCRIVKSCRVRIKKWGMGNSCCVACLAQWRPDLSLLSSKTTQVWLIVMGHPFLLDISATKRVHIYIYIHTIHIHIYICYIYIYMCVCVFVCVCVCVCAHMLYIYIYVRTYPPEKSMPQLSPTIGLRSSGAWPRPGRGSARPGAAPAACRTPRWRRTRRPHLRRSACPAWLPGNGSTRTTPWRQDADG